MKRISNKNGWVLLLLMLAGIVVGGFIATLAEKSAAFSWLSYGQSFGLDKPLHLNLGLVVLTFGFTIHITIGSIIGLVIAAVIYRFL